MPKYGELRKDGHRFWAMTRAGYENWLSPSAWRKSQRLLIRRAKARAERCRTDAKFRAAVRQGHRIWIHSHPVHTMLHKAKERARKHGVPFKLVPEDITIPTHCPVLGIRLVRNKSKVRMNSPTLDRVHPNRGYVKGNVIVVSQRANNIKSNATPEQILKVGKFYQKLWRDM